MKIILSPAKKMNVDLETLEPITIPTFIKDTEDILNWLKEKSFDELKSLWGCNDKLARENYERIQNMNLYERLTPAVLSYEGLAYQYMAPAVFEEQQYEYIQEHLCILSAFYGIIKPMDGVTPYRLEMQAKASINGCENMYQFWGDKLYREVRDESGIIINLASKEYSKCIEKYLKPEDQYITINFCEESKGKLVTKGTYAKMARGEMVKYMAENRIESPTDIQGFEGLGYQFRRDLSSAKEYVFERKFRMI